MIPFWQIRCAFAALVLTIPACRSHTWRPPMDAVRQTEQATLNLGDYLPQGGSFRQAFSRTRLESGAAPQPYERHVEALGHREGALIETGNMDLERCVTEREGEEPPEFFKWPGPPRQNNAGFILEFEPALDYLPADLRVDHPAIQECEVKAFNRWGHPAREGTVTRSVWLEGHEDVTASGVDYQDCVRLRAETHFRLRRLGPQVDVTEYLWLAPRVGEVKRIERITGLAIPFFFKDAYAYERIPDSGERAPPAADQPARIRPWRRVAVYLDHLLPKPHVGGAVVEFAVER